MVGVANDTATGMAKRKRDSLTDMSDSKRVSVGGPPRPADGVSCAVSSAAQNQLGGAHITHSRGMV